VICKAFAIPVNYLDMTNEKLISGRLPTGILIGLVDNAAFSGSRTLNTFNFQYYNISEIALYLEEHLQHTLKPI